MAKHCPCGGWPGLTSQSVAQHRKTKMHQEWLLQEKLGTCYVKERFGEEEYDPNEDYFYCKCGGCVINDSASRAQHRRTKRHEAYFGK